MNKQQKIIVSIVGITIVLLALLGITYAYYLTRIEGNTNTNSISITTADLKLVYGDGTTNILTKENIVPDNNNPVGTKDFTVTNIGNTTIDNYSVVLEYAVIDGVIPSVFKYPNDFEITLTCIDNEGNACNSAKIKFNNEAVTLTTASIDPNEVHNYTLEVYYHDSGIDQSDDMGKNLNLKVQIYELGETTDVKGTITGVDSTYSVKLTSNPKISSIVKTSDGSYSYAFSGVEVGTHTLRVLNKDGEEVSNQKIVIQKGDDIGFSTTTLDSISVPLITFNKENRVVSLTTNVNITNNTATNSGTSVNAFNPFEGNKNSLAYNIINKAIIAKNNNSLTETIYNSIPLTKPAKEINSEDEKTLSVTQDDYGASYYYRGDVEDNYVNFAGMCWKIVRIEGDGSVKIILASQKKCEQINSNDSTTAFIGTSEYSSDHISDIIYKYDDWFNGKVIINDVEQDRFSLEEKNKIKLKQYCIGDVDTKYDYEGNLITSITDGRAYFYNSYFRLYTTNASLETKLTCDKLSKKTEPTKIFALSVDEVIFAGAKKGSSNKNTYLYENTNWHTLTPAFYNSYQEINFIVESDGKIETRDSFPGEPSLRPSLSLIEGIEITSGEGTIAKPYIIDINS